VSNLPARTALRIVHVLLAIAGRLNDWMWRRWHITGSPVSKPGYDPTAPAHVYYDYQRLEAIDSAFDDTAFQLTRIARAVCDQQTTDIHTGRLADQVDLLLGADAGTTSPVDYIESADLLVDMILAEVDVLHERANAPVTSPTTPDGPADATPPG